MGHRSSGKGVEMIKTKRAQIFTLISAVLVVFTFITFQVFNTLEKREVIQTRVSTLDHYLKSIEKNLERQLFTSGFRAIFLAEDEIASKGEFIQNFTLFFNEAFFNGTVNGVPKEIMNGATKDYLIDSINSRAKKINAELNIENVSVRLYQAEPWHVTFNFSFYIKIKDNSNLVKWERKQDVITKVPIIGFEDPLFLVYTKSKVSRQINKTIYEGNYVVGTNVSNLKSHVYNGYYAENPSAPSFLKRLEGNLSADPQGIESFVFLPDLDKQGIPVLQKSTIDYIYFSSNSPEHYGVSGMPSWFRIDSQSNHLKKYNLTSLIIE